MKPKKTSSVARLTVGFLLVGRMSLAGTPPKKVASTHPNVILITIDTLRADHLACYGYKEIQTPTIDALAHDGVLFRRAISQVPLTWPSHAAILTGSYPFQNGVQDFTGHPLSSDFRSVAQAFQQSGYTTAAVVSSFVLDRSWGLARGFAYYDDAFSAKTFQEKGIGLVDRKAGDSVSHALAWLKRTQKRPFFLWLHLYDPHSPYDPPEPFRTEYRDHLYDGEIAYADHELGRMLSWLKQSGIYDRSLIVLLSDHGESLGEHGESEHGFFVYNATINIPLIVKPTVQSGIPHDELKQLVETIAVAPTLLHLAGLHDQIEKQFQRRNLFDRDSDQNAPAYSETFYPFSSFGWSPLHSLETSRYHYIEAPRPELYDLNSDPGEGNNIAATQPEVATVLKDQLKQLLTKTRSEPSSQTSTGTLNPDASQKLRALGYAAYRSPVSTETLAKGLADPKDKIAEFNSILQAQDAFRADQFSQGKELLNKIASEDPRMYIVPFLLGEAETRERDWNAAVQQFNRCLELNPNFDEAMTGLARALHGMGKDAESRSWLEKAVAANPQNYKAWYEFGSLDSRANPGAAMKAYEKAIAIQPNFAVGQRDLGILEVSHEQYKDALQHLNRALQLGLDDAHIRNFLGIAYTQTDHLVLAVKTLHEAIRQDPKLAEAHLNLGFAYQKLRRPTAAKSEYEVACRLQSRFCGVALNKPD